MTRGPEPVTRAPEPVTPAPARPVGLPILAQQWRRLTFLHWALPPDRVAPLLPRGVMPDTLDGVTYVGLVAFQMWRIGPFAGPGLPYLGTFAETNVRLYSVDTHGRRGVVFRSLEAARLLPVLVALGGFRLPYRWARMSLQRDGEVIRYQSRRRWPGPRGAATRIGVRIGPPIEQPTAAEHFMTARWGLHAAAFGRTYYLPNVHPPWSLCRAELLELNDELVAAAGLPGIADRPPDSVLYSPGVPVRFGRPLRPDRSRDRGTVYPL